jgi:phospholipid/cholesterol/gamma-HCH transport system substrate-binding protein
MKQNILETLVGAGVMAIAVTFIVFAINVNRGDAIGKEHYLLKARFQNIEGIVDGSDIMIAGIKVGTVKTIELDKNNFYAIAYLLINSDVKLPKDSQAAVSTSGIIGNKYIAITPGSEDEYLVNNEQIKYTQSAINIESLIGKIMYSIGK